MQEVFKPIPELKGKYECSNFGRIRRVNKDPRCEKYKYLKLQTNKDGYTYVHATRSYRKLVHRIVAQLFIPNPNNYPYVNHLDLNKKNNNINNLEWVTSAQNTQHAKDNGKIGNIRYIILDLESGIYYDSFKELTTALNKHRTYCYDKYKKNQLDKRYAIIEKTHRPHNEKTY